MVRIELIVLAVAIFGVTATESSFNDTRNPQVLVDNANDYIRVLSGTGCGTELITHTPPEVAEAFQQAQQILTDTTTEFCNLTFGEALQVGCVFTRACEEIGKPTPLMLETLFALYYGMKQQQHSHPESFSCKDAQGKELLGDIFKPECYTANYNLANGILTHPLPECPK